MSVAVGSLCTGFGGLDIAAEQVTGGTTVWHCEVDGVRKKTGALKGPRRLLAHRFPDVPNHIDVKALAWAKHRVRLLTGGYPCQPFSGAGKQLGTDDPRHIFPWIAQGAEHMRPELLLLENVANHLNVGFDVVLAELDRIGYDVRWTLLPASNIGAPHRRMRLWIAARDRDHGGWPAPAAEPTAYADGTGGWSGPQAGLFGDMPARKPGSAGVMVDGVRWDSHAVSLPSDAALFKTPTAQLAINGGSQHPDKRRQGGHGPTLADEVEHLLPTPKARDGKGRDPNPRGVDLNEAIALLPTPVTDPDSFNGHARNLGSEARALFPTPRATDGTKGGPNQRGSSGDLMLPSAVMQLLPTPAVNDMGEGKTVAAWDAWTTEQKAKHGNGNGHGASLAIEAARLALLPTPCVTDGRGARNATSGRQNGSQHYSGTTLSDVAYTGEWGPYTLAVRRWERLTRPAPPPTEPGRSGPRLSPAFVEWMMGLAPGWVTDVPDLSRNEKLALLGNGVVSQQAIAAYTLLGVTSGLLVGEVAA